MCWRELVTWRIETTRHFPGWHTAEGAFRVGGRWSSPGARVLYTSIDPATAIVEVAVHKGLHILDTVPRTLLAIAIASSARANLLPWIRACTLSSARRRLGEARDARLVDFR